MLKSELPQALAHYQRGDIAPVDLAQAAIGPGMAVFTRYAQVLDAEGNPLSVREALALINQTLDEALAEQEGDLTPHGTLPPAATSRPSSRPISDRSISAREQTSTGTPSGSFAAPTSQIA